MQTFSDREIVTFAGAAQDIALPHTSEAPAFGSRYTDIVTRSGEQKSRPIENPLSGVNAVLHIPAHASYTDEETVQAASVKTFKTIE